MHIKQQVPRGRLSKMAMLFLSVGLLASGSALETESHINIEQEQQLNLAAFESLEQQNQNEILASLHTGAEAQLEAQWGFLKNIINIDTFFAAGAGGPGCKDACSYKDHYKKMLKAKEDEEKAKKLKEEAESEKKRIAARKKRMDAEEAAYQAKKKARQDQEEKEKKQREDDEDKRRKDRKSTRQAEEKAEEEKRRARKKKLLDEERAEEKKRIEARKKRLQEEESELKARALKRKTQRQEEDKIRKDKIKAHKDLIAKQKVEWAEEEKKLKDARYKRRSDWESKIKKDRASRIKREADEERKRDDVDKKRKARIAREDKERDDRRANRRKSDQAEDVARDKKRSERKKAIQDEEHKLRESLKKRRMEDRTKDDAITKKKRADHKEEMDKLKTERLKRRESFDADMKSKKEARQKRRQQEAEEDKKRKVARDARRKKDDAERAAKAEAAQKEFVLAQAAAKAAETKRRAAEKAAIERIRLLRIEEAKLAAIEAARIKAAREAARLARLAAIAEAKRLAALRAKVAAEKARLRALAEAARLKKLRLAKEARARAAAAAAAKLAAEKKAAYEKLMKEKARKEAIEAARTAREEAERKAKAAEALAIKRAKQAYTKARRGFMIESRKGWFADLIETAGSKKFAKRQRFQGVMIRKLAKSKVENDFQIMRYSAFYAWNVQDAYKQFAKRFADFSRRGENWEVALFSGANTYDGRMAISSTAFYKDFDYDFQLKTEGKAKYDYDFTDKWSKIMIGLGGRQQWIRIDFKSLKLKNVYRAIYLEEGKVKVQELTTSHGSSWSKFSKDFVRTKRDAVYVHSKGYIYSTSGKYKMRNGFHIASMDIWAMWLHSMKINMDLSFEAGDMGIYTWEEYQLELKERNSFIDGLKLVDDEGRWRRHHPFWIHYQWKSDKHNGARGQFQYFRSWNYKYAFERFRTIVRQYNAKNHDIVFTLSTGDAPRRQVLLSSEPMDGEGTQSIIGWLFWNRFITLPAQVDSKKWWTLLYKEAKQDSAIDIVEWQNEDMDTAVKTFWATKNAKPQHAAVLLDAAGIVRNQGPAKVKSGFRKGYQTTYEMMGQFIQAEYKMCSQMVLKSTPIGYLTAKDQDKEQADLKNYKIAYQRRMNAYANSIIIERSKLLRQNRSKKLNTMNGHKFSIAMWYSKYNKGSHVTSNEDARFHSDQFFNNYRNIHYVMQRYNDWVRYRTRWFVKNAGMRTGPEFMLTSEDRVLWTTATGEEKAGIKKGLMGHLFQKGRLDIDKKQVTEHTFYWAAADGKLSSIGCKDNFGQCYNYLKQYLKRFNFMPCMLMKKGGKVHYQRGMTGAARKVAMVGDFNYDSTSTMWRMQGDFLVSFNAKFEHQGSVWNFKASGIKLEKTFTKKYQFYVYHTRRQGKGRRSWVWRYYSNNFERVMKWYGNRSQLWHKGNKKNSATGIFMRIAKGVKVIKLEPTQDYQSRAWVVGKAWQTVENSLNAQCFAKFAAKGGDFFIYNTPNQPIQHQFQSGHNGGNLKSFRQQIKRNNQQGVIFWPQKHGKGYKLRLWTIQKSRSQPFNWQELVGRFLMKHCPNTYQHDAITLKALGLPTN